MKILKEFLKESLISPQRGCYQLLNNHFFSNILQGDNKATALKEFFEFLAIFDTKALKFIEGDEFAFFHKMKKESKQIYSIFESPIEELENIEFFDEIKQAIKYRQYCDIIYNEKEPKILKDVEPQKILYAKNNWYLAVMSKTNYQKNGGFKRLRINFIDEFKLKTKTFQTNIQAQMHIQNMQSLFQDFESPNYEVQVRVSYEVSRYFRVKKYLSSQKLISEEKNGDLILSFQINDDMEIIPLIKTWIPHLKVISPTKLDNKIKEELSKY
jgi:predicted DNA-binding transcriptional regulator YafY